MRNFATSARFRSTTRRDIKYSFGKQSRESRITRRCYCYPRCEKMGGVSLSELNWSKQKHTAGCWPLAGREKVPLVKNCFHLKVLEVQLNLGLSFTTRFKLSESAWRNILEIIVDFTTKLVDWLERGMLFFCTVHSSVYNTRIEILIAIRFLLLALT